MNRRTELESPESEINFFDKVKKNPNLLIESLNYTDLLLAVMKPNSSEANWSRFEAMKAVKLQTTVLKLYNLH